jgi:hypothetical protein
VPRLPITTVAVLVACLGAVASLAVPASAKTLTLVEGPGARVLEPGDAFSLFAYSSVPVAFRSSAGAVECPYNMDTTYGILRGTDTTNGRAADRVSILGGLGTFGTKVACNSTIASFKGPVYVETYEFDWTLKLSANGKVTLSGGPKLGFDLYNGEEQHCYLERKTVEGTFDEGLELELTGKLSLNSASSAGCPKSAELDLTFVEAGSQERLEAAHRIYAVAG